MSCMRQGVFTLSGAPSTTRIFTSIHFLLIFWKSSKLVCIDFDPMRDFYLYNPCISVYNTCTLILNIKKYNVHANLDAPDNAISGNDAYPTLSYSHRTLSDAVDYLMKRYRFFIKDGLV